MSTLTHVQALKPGQEMTYASGPAHWRKVSRVERTPFGHGTQGRTLHFTDGSTSRTVAFTEVWVR